jgi:nitroimidazol reductase NimA-like FMN-containing flavoprotein (pyridoxamine 5'-phosphate oxidase superfamily)
MSDHETIGNRTMSDLERDECLELMTTRAVGRVVFVQDGRPVAFPVNHAVHGTDVVFKTIEGSSIAVAAAASEAAAFEVDHFEQTPPHSGWSVLVQGEMGIVTDADEQAALERLSLTSWLPDLSRHQWAANSGTWQPVGSPRWVRIRATDVSGRRTQPA